MAAMPMMRLLAPAFWGAIADRLGKKAVLVRNSMLVSALAFSGFLLTNNFIALVAIMLVMSMFWSASLPLVEALTLGHLRNATERYGSVRLWGSVGFIVAVQGSGLLLGWLPLDAILWVSLGLLLAASASAAYIPDTEILPYHRDAGPLSKALLQPKVVALLLAGFLMSVAHSPLYTFYSMHLVGHGYGKGSVGALWSLGVIAEIGVFAWMPKLMASGSLRKILAACFLLAALRFALIGWLMDSPLIAVFAQLLHGASFGAHHAASITALNKWFSPRQQGTVQSLFGSISYGAGGVFGGVFSGYSWDAYGASITYSGAALFALLGLLLIWFGVSGEDGQLERSGAIDVR